MNQIVEVILDYDFEALVHTEVEKELLETDHYCFKVYSEETFERIQKTLIKIPGVNVDISIGNQAHPYPSFEDPIILYYICCVTVEPGI